MITLAQINPTVGDIDGNVKRIAQMAASIKRQPDSLIVFPEMAICGYPPEDLLLRDDFQAQCFAAIEQLAARSKEELPAMIVGGIWHEKDTVFNAAFYLADGKIQHIHKKIMLPNEGIFDEKRYFSPGQAPLIFNHAGVKMGLLICEDAWHEHLLRLLNIQGCEQLIVINASPFETDKLSRRQAMIAQHTTQNALPIAYVNLVGGQDDLIFDGSSFALDSSGELLCQLPAFEEACIDISNARHPVPLQALACKDQTRDPEKINENTQPSTTSLHVDPTLRQDDGGECSTTIRYQAASLGLKDYVNKNGFKGVVLGLSGGIDSALAGALAVDALGAARVTSCMLATEFTSKESIDDAAACAKYLGIRHVQIPIKAAMQTVGDELIPALNALDVTTENWESNLTIGGNIQARLRAVYLMALSNALGLMLLNTSNKSEIAVGYSTLYGDSCGGYAPLKDLYKTDIYALAKWRDLHPKRIITKPASAELKPNQKDEDQLPPYDVLDAILKAFIDEGKSIDDIIKNGQDEALVRRIISMITTAEYKRRQAPPGAKIGAMQFTRDWRYPLTNGFHNGE